MVPLRPPLTLNSYAKLNPYLAVLDRRKDNYHNIETIFERIDLCDKIIFNRRPDKKIKITCDSAGVPLNSSNLAYKAARLLQDSFKPAGGLDLKIIKRIPVGSGLGGGSSNAATVLKGLNKLWGLGLSRHKLVGYAKKIGADVPFFIYDVPFAQGLGRGDKIRRLNSLERRRFWHILVVPAIKVSTPLIYRKWDIKYNRASAKAGLTPHLFNIQKIPKYMNPALLRKYGMNKIKGAGLTIPPYNVNILYLALRRNNFSLLGRALFNGLEQITAKTYPEIRRIKEKLAQLGLKSVLMSGSGGAVFGFVSSRKEAGALAAKLKKNRGWQVFVTRTL